MRNEGFRNYVDAVKDAVDIVEVIGRRIPLNNRHMAKCPFHDDKNPSFSVNPNGQYFHCFGCGVGGDVFKFLMLFDKQTFKEALKSLADYTGVETPRTFQRR
jgi:DNA primase